MTNQSMELFEMQKSKQDEQEDSKIDKNLFIRKILLYAFTEYYVTFMASFGLEYLPSYIPFYCFVPLSLGFQIYFEFQVEMRDESLRSTLNYIFGGLSIISNCFCNFYLWNLICYREGTVIINFIYLKLLFVGQILTVLFIFMFYTNISKINFNNKVIWLIPTFIPLFLQFVAYFFTWDYYNGSPLFQTMIVTWLLIMMVVMVQEMKQKQNTYDEIFVQSCRLLAIPFQIVVYLMKFFMISYHSYNYLFQGSNKEKVAYLRKVSVTFFTICFFITVSQTQTQFCHFYAVKGRFCNSLIDMSNYRFQNSPQMSFKTLFWISLCISTVAYFTLLLGHKYLHWILNWIIFSTQIIFFSFTVFGVGWYAAMYQLDSSSEGEGFWLFNLYEAGYCSLCGLSIGLLVYAFNMSDNLYNKIKALIYMMLCPICIWISQIYAFTKYDSTYIGYSFSILLFYFVFSFWIAFELEWQLNVKTFEFKQHDYHIGAIQIFEPFFSITSRLIGLFM